MTRLRYIYRSLVAFVMNYSVVKNLVRLVQKTIMILYVFTTRLLRFDVYTDHVLSNMAPDNMFRKEKKHGSRKQERIHI